MGGLGVISIWPLKAVLLQCTYQGDFRDIPLISEFFCVMSLYGSVGVPCRCLLLRAVCLHERVVMSSCGFVTCFQVLLAGSHYLAVFRACGILSV